MVGLCVLRVHECSSLWYEYIPSSLASSDSALLWAVDDLLIHIKADADFDQQLLLILIQPIIIEVGLIRE